MVLKNTVHSYGSVAKFFHWVTAILFLISYSSIYYREWFSQSDFQSWITIQLHLSVGISLGGLVVLRVLWRLFNQLPNSEVDSQIQRVTIQLGHISLYAIMIIMPISGYLSIANYLSVGGGNINYFFLFDLTFLKNVEIPDFIGTSLEQLEDPADLIHSFLGQWVVGLLVLGHVIAAIYHHVIKRDDTLNKMTFGKS